MMNCGHNNNCCEVIDEFLEQIQSGLGKVDYDAIDSYIDEKFQELKDGISSGDITVDVDLDDLIAKIKEAIADGTFAIDAYDVLYKDTTVGEALDELLNEEVEFTGTISKLRTYTKGEVVYNTPVSFSFNKEVKSLKLYTYVNDMNGATLTLDPADRRVEIPVLNATTQIVIKAVSVDDEELTLETLADFRLKYYVGSCGASRISNKETTSLSSYYAYEETTDYSFIFHPIGSQYLWWIFPVDLHTDYDFFNNGHLDSNYVWTTGNLKNEYGYTAPYLFIRSGNPHTASNIYSEVKAHEHKQG